MSGLKIEGTTGFNVYCSGESRIYTEANDPYRFINAVGDEVKAFNYTREDGRWVHDPYTGDNPDIKQGSVWRGRYEQDGNYIYRRSVKMSFRSRDAGGTPYHLNCLNIGGVSTFFEANVFHWRSVSSDIAAGAGNTVEIRLDGEGTGHAVVSAAGSPVVYRLSELILTGAFTQIRLFIPVHPIAGFSRVEGSYLCAGNTLSGPVS